LSQAVLPSLTKPGIHEVEQLAEHRATLDVVGGAEQS
jgi:hypothetical protein